MSASKMSRKKIRIRFILLIVVGVAILGTLIALLVDAPERQELQALTIGDVDFTRLRDGIYAGEYAGTKGSSRNATVQVTVSDAKITKIIVLKGALDSNGKPVKLTGEMTINDLFQRVLKTESLQVDTISGATLTSKAHLKALELALKQAQQ
ncbi:FMN-binding protein [Paenibacillus brevis]|uniref:FMN-binding protein n=1 Tax=Paenibacillus brevis TaxID=2841508 RepID=A0ABS6FRF0_9BACL|nr:FMN-binding protein [Paenibacillus brevis]MBU5672815.1 FMN-binding protein [Paenibacillus brevis]